MEQISFWENFLPGAKDTLRLVLVGLQGVGKSSSGNTILGSKEFQSGISSSSLTLKSEIREGLVCGRSVMVVDTPGLFNTELSDTQMKQEMEKALTLCQPGPHFFLIVIQLGRFTEQESGVMEELNEVLESHMNQYSMVLFTYGDKLINKTIDQFIREDKNLQRLIHKCGGNVHVFNNANPKNTAQVSELLEKIETQIRKRKKTAFYVKGEKKYPWATTICVALPLTLLVFYTMVANRRPLPVQNEDSLSRSLKLWQILTENRKGLIPLVLGFGALWYLRKVWR